MLLVPLSNRHRIGPTFLRSDQKNLNGCDDRLLQPLIRVALVWKVGLCFVLTYDRALFLRELNMNKDQVSSSINFLNRAKYELEQEIELASVLQRDTMVA